jgi:indolepyruvate ferredoxin oxidoreductase beta subunit
MKKLSEANVLICGVGGQGVLLFSDVLSQAAMVNGMDVKKSEVHGMAQRGGSVTSHVRFGTKVFSPLIEEGTADFIVAFEQLEALRYLHFLSPTGWVLIDTLQWKPMPVLIGAAEYPSDVIERVKAAVSRESGIAKRIQPQIAQIPEDSSAGSGNLALSAKSAKSAVQVPSPEPRTPNPGSRRVYVVEAFNKAKELGQSRAQNIVMLGALSTMLAIPQETFEETIRQSVKPKFVDLNLKAFAEGRKLV